MMIVNILFRREVIITGLVLLCVSVASIVYYHRRLDDAHEDSLTSGPRIVINCFHKDIGVVIPGVKKEIEFALHNSGTKDLVISNLNTSCGCSPATLDVNPINPGESTTVLVNFQAPLSAGTVTHAIMFETNDPENTHIKLTFDALVKRPINVVPPELFVGLVMAGGSASHQIELCSSDAKPFHVKDIISSVPWIQVEGRPSPCEYRRLFRIQIKGDVQPRAFSETLHFVTNCKDQKDVIVYVKGEISTPYGVCPSSLFLRNAVQGDIVDTKLFINQPGYMRRGISSLELKDKDWKLISWTIRPPQLGSSSLIEIRLRVSDIVGYRRTKLVLHDADGNCIQEIPVSCLVKRKDL